MICKIVNAGESHGHMERILSSKIVNSESSAPKYFLYKDHKKEESWRPVVSGCSSNTLGLSNMLSDIVESLCGTIAEPYEVISSEDLLSRCEKFNEWASVQESDWREKYMLLGSDVCALFPSLSKDKTAKAVRNQASKIDIKWENIDIKWLTLYVHLNRHLSSGLDEVSHLLPKKRPGKRGREPGLSSIECMQRYLEDEFEINGKLYKSSWIWPELKPTEKETKLLMAAMLEISVKFFFDNFVYSFGGENYVQGSGGPIGARITMCISRLVMQEWWEEFKAILDASNIEYLMHAIYVDDGRIIIEKLKPGIRFCEKTKMFKFKQEWLEEDIETERTALERTEYEVARAMNSISPDLVFTTETENDFANKRLPTLSFQLWSERNGLRHSYYEKDMRAQVLTMKRSSQSEQSKFSILVNELQRRFEVLDKNIENEEKVDIIDHYTQQLVNSGYSSEQVREIVESGMKGVLKKEKRRNEGDRRYRSSKETLYDRNIKKLTENTNWYREADNPENEEESNVKRKKEKERSWNGWRKINVKRKRNEKVEIDVDGRKKIMSVIFIQHTDRSELAKKMRERLKILEQVGDLKFKIVEKTGSKLEDLLHQSNAWSDLDCCREDCIMCESAKESEKKGQCFKRNVVYETYCEICQETFEKKKFEKKLYEEIEINEVTMKADEKDKNDKKRKREEATKESQKIKEKENGRKKDYKVKYVGETGRSGYERGLEHLKDFENCDETSHLLKHYLLFHKDMKRSDMKFGMRLRKNYRTPIERQIGEAVAIDVERRKGTTLMNSKSEYNRCKIARISTKSDKETMKEMEKETEVEEILKKEMKEIRIKKREKKREEETSKENKRKRQKIEEIEKDKENEKVEVEKEAEGETSKEEKEKREDDKETNVKVSTEKKVKIKLRVLSKRLLEKYKIESENVENKITEESNAKERVEIRSEIQSKLSPKIDEKKSEEVEKVVTEKPSDKTVKIAKEIVEFKSETSSKISKKKSEKVVKLSVNKSSQLSMDKFVKKKDSYSSNESSEMDKMNVEEAKEHVNTLSELSMCKTNCDSARESAKSSEIPLNVESCLTIIKKF